MDDETKMLIFGTDGRKYALCIREEVNPDCIEATTKNSTSITIRECMSANIVGCLHIIDIMLNSRKYINTILQPKLLPYIRDVFSDGVSFFYHQGSTLRILLSLYYCLEKCR